MTARRSVSIRLEANLADRLSAAAEERVVSVSWLASRLLAEGIDRLIPADELRLTTTQPDPEREPT